ncbi:uncharacterized protein LOC120337213 [Styela clava]
MWTMLNIECVHNKRHCLGALFVFLFFQGILSCSSAKPWLSCGINGSDEHGQFLQHHENFTIICKLQDLNTSELWTVSYLKTTIVNSTFRKIYNWGGESSNSTIYQLPISFKDLFHEYDDKILPITYSYSNLKWNVITVFHSPVLENHLWNHFTVSYLETDSMFRFSWGTPLKSNSITITGPQIVFATLPCQPGSGLVIISSSSNIFVAVSWNNFKDENNILWYDATCHMQGIGGYCAKFMKIYDAVFAFNRLYLVSSGGIFSSSLLDSECVIQPNGKCMTAFEKSNLPELSDIDVLWEKTKLIYSPVCAHLDPLSIPGDGIVLSIMLKSEQTSMLMKLVKPFKTWELVEKSFLLNSMKLGAIHFNIHTQMIVTGQYRVTDNVSSSYSVTYPISDIEKNKIRPLIFSLGNFIPYQIISLSNHFIYMVGKFALLYSVDGGITYLKLKDLKRDELLVQAVKHEWLKSIAFLFNSGRILVTQVGFTDVHELQSNMHGITKLIFNNNGVLFALKIFTENIGNLPVLSIQEIQIRNKKQCTSSLILSGKNLLKSVVFLDVGAKFHIEMNAVHEPNLYSNSTRFPTLETVITNPQILHSKIEIRNLTLFNQQVSVTVQNVMHSEGISAVTIFLRDTDSACRLMSHTIHIISTCPLQKQVVFDYSSFVPYESLLSIDDYVNLSKPFEDTRVLDKNYRPPSAIGISIPLSKNIYNFDPSYVENTRLLNYGFAGKHMISEYCKGEWSNNGCLCNSAMKFSSLQEYANCRERVYKVKYDTEYHLHIKLENDIDEVKEVFSPSEYLVYLEEINGRTSDVFYVTDGGNRLCMGPESNPICYQQSNHSDKSFYDTVSEFASHGTNNQLFNSTTLTIKFLGTGLFHFRIVLANGFSYCKLKDEFQVYVTNPPLPFPVGTIIRLTVSVMMGGALVAIYVHSIRHCQAARSETASKEDSENKVISGFRRTNASIVTEDDVINLRNKFRASFQTK